MIDTAFISRLQFAFTISFHILFPTFSIGMAAFLAVMEGVYLKTKNPHFLKICKFWTKIFALTFGMGIVSGIVMEFQFGTNWAGFTKEVGGVLGALFTYEVLTAFFIEAGFLGVMLFGWDRVGPRLHYFATLLVVIGTTFSAFWILSANSWMQTPSGVTNVNGVFEVKNWLDVIFNPSVIPRYFHMLTSAYVATGFMITGMMAYYLLKKQHTAVAKTCFSFALAALAILTPLQIFLGDAVGTEVHRNQPLKTAAMEAVWDTQRGAPFVIFAYPDQKLQKNLYSIEIPNIASLINTHQWNGELIGLKTVKPSDQPNVPVVFFSFRIMVGLGFLMFFMAMTGLWLRMRKRLFTSRWFLQSCIIMAPSGFIALWMGWITAEVGRQPWIVYGLLRTVDAASKVPMHDVIISFVLLIIVYGFVFGFFYFYYLSRILLKGPGAEPDESAQPFTYLHTSDKGEK